MADKFSPYIGLPRDVRIAGCDVRLIVKCFEDGDKCGQWIARDATIELSVDQTNKAFAVDTLLHELTHAMWKMYGLEKGDSEERIATVMGTAWTQVWRDNPRLLAWVAKALKD